MKTLLLTGLCVLILAGCSVRVDMDKPEPGKNRITCENRADQRGLYGVDRDMFVKGCMTCTNAERTPPPRIQKKNECEAEAQNNNIFDDRKIMFLEGCYSCD